MRAQHRFCGMRYQSKNEGRIRDDRAFNLMAGCG